MDNIAGKITLSIRTQQATGRSLKDVAAETGANLSETGEEAIKTWLHDRQRAPSILMDAARLAFGGPDNVGLLWLIGELLKRFVPRGDWIDDQNAFALMARAVARLLARLRAPEDPHVFRDRSVEGRVDEFLYNAGIDGSAYPGTAPTFQQRWAEDLRERLGPTLSARLIQMRENVRRFEESQPPRDDQFANVRPEDDGLWDAARAPHLAARVEQQRKEAADHRQEGERRRAAAAAKRVKKEDRD